LKENKSTVIIKNDSLPETSVENTEEIPHIPETIKKSITVTYGDTLMELLVREGINKTDASRIISSLSEVFNPRQLHQGQEVTLIFKTLSDSSTLLQSLIFIPDLTREIQINRSSEKAFESNEIIHKLEKKTVKAKVEIKGSLYESALDNGMPIEVLIKMIRAYSYDVDFQRDVKPGDSFEALYEKIIDKNGNFVKGGELLYASLDTNGRLSTYTDTRPVMV
jgi:hypothetical protein